MGQIQQKHKFDMYRNHNQWITQNNFFDKIIVHALAKKEFDFNIYLLVFDFGIASEKKG